MDISEALRTLSWSISPAAKHALQSCQLFKQWAAPSSPYHLLISFPGQNMRYSLMSLVGAGVAEREDWTPRGVGGSTNHFRPFQSAAGFLLTANEAKHNCMNS